MHTFVNRLNMVAVFINDQTVHIKALFYRNDNSAEPVVGLYWRYQPAFVRYSMSLAAQGQE